MEVGVRRFQRAAPAGPDRYDGALTQTASRRDRMRIALIPGDGIGKDVSAEALKAIQAVAALRGTAIDVDTLPWGADHFLATGITVPDDGYQQLRRYDAVFVGAVGDPRVPDNRHARDIL